ncbi:MAG: phenylalanine--tRNA ligase subunit beta [Acidobacteria bacterium]|nr:phenylalanine--tRNA ligase subunit beta [Acidobacteriota bacterium]
MRFSRDWIAAYTELPDGSELYEAMSMLGFVVDDARPNGDDVLLDLDFPSNRPDAMNHWSIAREIAVSRKQPVQLPEVSFDAEPGADSGDFATVRLDDAACIRFVGRVALDVEVGPSPAWLCERLESIGLRPINNVVDITNFVMWEVGRPMHAYDLDKLAGNAIVVRRAHAGEHLITLDDVDRELTENDLVIADNSRVVGLAGVMGGNDTGVTESTTRVLLECAFFDAVTVRRMSKRHGMHTDASHRFERGLSVDGIDQAVDRACALMQETAGARLSATAIDVTREVPPARSLELSRERLHGLLGTDVESEEVARILTALDFTVDTSESGYGVGIPARRVDVTLEVDLVEEVARFVGYDQLPTTLPVLRRPGGGGPQPSLIREQAIREIATGLGFWEAISFVFTARHEQDQFAAPESDYVQLSNPLSEAFAVMRRHITPNLVAAASRNHNVGAGRVRLFEVGRTFAPKPEGGVDERRTLALLMTGSSAPASWVAGGRAGELGDVVGAMETIWNHMRWPSISWAPAEHQGFQSGACAAISCEGATIGLAGKIDPAAAAAFGLEVDAWIAEIDIEDYIERPTSPPAIAALPRYPAAERDVSLIVGDSTPFAKVAEALVDAAGTPLVEHRLLERYRGEDLPESTTAWTLRLTYRSDERTLTAEEIEQAHTTAVGLLVKHLDARQR